MKLKSRLKSYLAPNSLRFQLLSRSLLLLAGLLIVIGGLQYIFMQGFLYQNQAKSIQTQIQSVPPDAWVLMASNDQGNSSATANNSAAPPDSGLFFPHHHGPFFFLPDTNIALIDQDGTFTELTNGSTSGSINGETSPRLAEQDYQYALQSNDHHLSYKIVNSTGKNEQLIVLETIRTKDHTQELVQVSLSTKPLKDMMLHQLLVFLGVSLGALVIGILAFIPVLRKTLVPLSNMVDKVEQIDAGNLAERIPVDQGQVEIDHLANSFNGMLQRLESSFDAEIESKEQMRRFVADASHELRTPLTAIHGFLEVLLRGAVNQPDMLDRSLKSMYAESERMKKLVEDLLLLAKLDRSPKIQRNEIMLDEVIKEMAPQLRLLAGERKVVLKLTSDLKGWFDVDRLKQVILNLFHNAVQHTDAEQGEIQISLTKVRGGVELSVHDNGSGISEKHLSKLFDRFYRSDSSRTRKYGGSGLGLSITKSIVELHGGTIRVESAVDEGTTFYVWLPLAEEA
ncbi:signal transduction histidine kinase [Desulfosporosinus acidiphilus SJ4]|uniref:histidine kinase n=1 Tax=Desulfosporosinus acidiphilus (strain DSM 22704 / JCM 16185 / SJ4) TaxID=646529 RepID=I4D4N8_DESAJ|nr:HAMP domain-containing sensor histidine kinase [Desulfosporosinus acidiphilus]AFM40762.1 signal transduction histidine kinase [Desulfosporosinus acidiphilus SJ4]